MLSQSEIKQKIEAVPDLEGMTVNERLYETGLLDEFDKYLKSNPEHITFILESLKVDKPSILKILA